VSLLALSDTKPFYLIVSNMLTESSARFFQLLTISSIGQSLAIIGATGLELWILFSSNDGMGTAEIGGNRKY
jgi:hypothetical protein